MKKLARVSIAVFFLFASCDSFLSTVKEREIINNSSHDVQFTLQPYGDKVFTLEQSKRMSLKLPQFPAGKIVSTDKPVYFRAGNEVSHIKDLPIYQFKIINTTGEDIELFVTNDRFCDYKDESSKCTIEKRISSDTVKTINVYIFPPAYKYNLANAGSNYDLTPSSETVYDADKLPAFVLTFR
ncbi:MAG: hypothetical protein J6I73_06590 [Treponema sp.]|nr:hypothetical protein [Treponema sp.]